MPASSFRLGNGLQLVVIPDRRSPIVTHMIRYRVGSYSLRLDTSAAIAALLLALQLDGRDPGWLDERNRQIAAVMPDDAARAAGRLFGDGRLLVATAGDPAGL